MFPRLLAVFVCGLAAAALAAPPAPPEPDTWNALLRYQISSTGNDRIVQYRAFRAALKKAGFVRDADEEEAAENEAIDTGASRMTGTVPAAKVGALLQVRFVRSVVLSPAAAKIPDKGSRVRVDVTLASGFTPETQRKLARQTAAALTKAGFIEAVGYDHQKDTRLVGSVPAENVSKLLDVRALVPADEQEAPFNTVPAVRKTVVRPDWPVPAGPKRLAEVPRGQEKFSPALRSLLGGAGAGTKQRLEVILGAPPREANWWRDLEQAGVVVEGRTGPLVTVLGVPRDAAGRLAARTDVVAVRLPRRGIQAPLLPGTSAPAKWEAVKASGVTSLHALGHKGQGTRIVLIADDFTGWQKLKGAKLFDVTAERNRDLLPDPFPSAGKAEGHGTLCARAIQKAAPAAELTLVRIDAAAPYMMEEVARAINGERVRPLALEQRFRDEKSDREALDAERERVAKLRESVLASDVLNEKELREKQENYKKAQQAYDAAEEAYRGRLRRAMQFDRDLAALKGARIVASALVWPDGHPVDGSSALSRYFDDRAFRAALWFQAAGDTAGQAWAGAFRDADGNGRVELTDGTRLPVGSWSPELNFLGWQTRGGKVGAALPAGAKVRLTLQWREAHDPTPLRAGEDPYRSPLAKLRLVVVYQPDPAGAKRPADDLEVVTATVGDPQRLSQSLHSATYEHTLDLDVTRPGRYAAFIEGTAPESIYPPGENPLPAKRRKGELNLRLFAQTLAGDGRAVWSDFATRAAALGMPADSRQVITVAAADASGAAQASSAAGSPFGLSLLPKPDVLSYDEGDGSAAAASFAAGLAAASARPRSGGLAAFREAVVEARGQVLRVPAARPR